MSFAEFIKINSQDEFIERVNVPKGMEAFEFLKTFNIPESSELKVLEP